MITIEQKNIETVSAFIEAFWNQSDMESTENIYQPIIKSIRISQKKV
ncbi:hypothetical protein M5X11_35215 [Paenibacillus alginolyticus]|nr:hypothetical protein [Paenibacillus alginolyticus]MCY9670091.1 hypothetical protein [Paenibacillus alginolyticus]